MRYRLKVYSPNSTYSYNLGTFEDARDLARKYELSTNRGRNRSYSLRPRVSSSNRKYGAVVYTVWQVGSFTPVCAIIDMGQE